MATNYFQGLPVPKELKDALALEVEEIGGGGGGGGSTTIIAPPVFTDASLTLTDDDKNQVIRVSSASNAVAIRIPDTLTGGNAGDEEVFETAVLITDATTNPVTIATGAGLLTPVLSPPGAVITNDDTWVVIEIVRGIAYVAIVSPEATGFEGAPNVQAVHTSPTRTIAASDANTIIPYSSASNAIANTIPSSLYESLGTGKAFVFSGEIRNITNPITLAGSGGLVLVYYGPRTTLTTVGDTFVVVIVSATLARVYIAASI